MKVSKNSKYQTHEKSKRRNWRASGPFGIFQHILSQNIKKLRGENFFEKKSQCRKKLKGGTL